MVNNMRNLFLAVAALSLLLAAGCKATPERIVYNSLSATGNAVDVAMSAAADAKVAGRITDEQWDKIAEAHGKYQPAYALAVELAAFDYESFTPKKVGDLAQLVIDTVFTYVDRP